MFSLTPAMMTGISHLDMEHQDLVITINRIHAAETDGDIGSTQKWIAKFRTDLMAHFEEEEAYLEKLKYPAREAHAKHHVDTLIALGNISEGLRNEATELGGIAAQCFDDLLKIVLTMDMRFMNWHADQVYRA